ncbi:hypothetical protein IH922_01385 [candidate division KSB1 bacterium]|nr:hypothetical protein [candidate division KSB1 bacterium]
MVSRDVISEFPEFSKLGVLISISGFQPATAQTNVMPLINNNKGSQRSSPALAG